MSLRIDVNDPTDVPLANTSRFAQAAEAGGFDGVGMPDHHHTGRDVFVRLALAAAATERVTLFPAVTNPVTRHPAVVASLANSLAELAPGRVRIMLGSGDQATSFVGRPQATVGQMREAALAIRALLRGEEATLAGAEIGALRNPAASPPPVYVNASGPRMLEVAGEVADGVYAMVGVHPSIVARTREHVAAGAKRAGRSSAGVPLALGLPVFMGATADDALQAIRPYVFGYISRPHRVYARVMRELLPDLPELAAPADIPKPLLRTLADAIGLVGTLRECAEGLAALVASTGADHFVCRVSYAGKGPLAALDVFAREVVAPALGRV